MSGVDYTSFKLDQLKELVKSRWANINMSKYKTKPMLIALLNGQLAVELKGGPKSGAVAATVRKTAAVETAQRIGNKEEAFNALKTMIKAGEVSQTVDGSIKIGAETFKVPFLITQASGDGRIIATPKVAPGTPAPISNIKETSATFSLDLGSARIASNNVYDFDFVTDLTAQYGTNVIATIAVSSIMENAREAMTALNITEQPYELPKVVVPVGLPAVQVPQTAITRLLSPVPSAVTVDPASVIGDPEYKMISGWLSDISNALTNYVKNPRDNLQSIVDSEQSYEKISLIKKFIENKFGVQG